MGQQECVFPFCGESWLVAPVRPVPGTDCVSQCAEFQVKYVAPKIPFGLTEQFNINKPTVNKRRDRRSGPQEGVVKLTSDGILAISTWGDPNAGRYSSSVRLPAGCMGQNNGGSVQS